MRIVKINKLFESIVLEVINYVTPIKNTNRGRPSTYSNKTYLDAIFYVLKEGIGWNYIRGLCVTGDAIRKVYNKWVNMNVFQLSWRILLDIYSEFKLDFNDVYIDASHIKNYMGTEVIGGNHSDRFRKATKISIIVDDIGVPIGIHMDRSNVHDVKLAPKTIENINVPIDTTEYIIGDKGYISSNLNDIIANKYKAKLIVPRKKKYKIEGKIRGRKPKYEHKLKNRFVVERTYSWFKHYTILFRRKDKKISTFTSFIFMGASNIIANKIMHVFSLVM